MGLRSLTSKILLTALLNVVLLVVALLGLVRFQLAGDFESFLMNSARERVLSVSREVALELEETDAAGRTALMARFQATHNLDFFLFDNDGTQLGGRQVTLPAVVEDRLKEGQRPGAEPSTVVST